jgi:hypothetical protein|tara:strand:- start:24103 stop:24339 length:237 start_codon:yes stop_codon:yes gene_type:complete
MTEFNELVEFLLAHREEGYPGHKIIENAQEEFEYLQGKSTEEYYGLQLDGKDKIHITYFNMKHSFKLGALVYLDVQDN